MSVSTRPEGAISFDTQGVALSGGALVGAVRRLRAVARFAFQLLTGPF